MTTHAETTPAPEIFEASFILDVGGKITADLIDLTVKHSPITGGLQTVEWTNAPGGRGLHFLNLNHVIAVITETPQKEHVDD